MIEKVCKRDGTIVPFEERRIYQAISYAYADVYGELSEEKEDEVSQITDNVVETLNLFTDTIHVETIQDVVEQEISAFDFYVAKAYITYRYKRAMARNTTDNAVMELVGGKSDYWNNENSNKDAMLATTQRDYLAGIVSTDITERMLLPKDVVEADKEGIIHFHDKDYFIEPINNCFSGNTSFVTSDGVRRFKDCVEGEEVLVVDKNGNWQKATVRRYGKQKMQIVELQSGRTIKTVKCTYNHRWVLKDGTVTTNLKIGDRLYCTPPQQNKFKILPKYFCMGFVIGDGCDYTHSGEGVQVRLCGDKAQYVKYFLSAGYTIGQVNNSNDIICYKKGFAYKNNFITTKAWKYLSQEELYSLFEGYYAADGFKDRNGISTANPYLAEMIREISSVTGRYVYSEKINTKPTNYSANRILYEFRFCKYQPSNKNWIVKNIIRNDQSQYDAWCVEEPNTHTFTLDGGIITGNCCLINLEDMLQNGTVVNKVAIEKPHRFITAMTIATQIITAVASSQYGGTTITLTHLAPFVRDSWNYYVDKYQYRGFSKAIADELAREDLKKEIADGVQTFNYQINSMSTTNGQAPFISVCMYLNEDTEYTHEVALIIEEFLNQRILGMKNEKGVYVTQAFPKLLYVLDENNIYPDSKYYYLTELAAKCTAKRMNPDFISAKVMRKLKGDVYPCINKICA